MQGENAFKTFRNREKLKERVTGDGNARYRKREVWTLLRREHVKCQQCMFDGVQPQSPTPYPIVYHFYRKKNLFHKVINLRLKITTPSACLPNKTDKSPKFTGSLDR